MQESDYVKVQETLESLNVKCPAFHHGCPFSNPHGRLTSDLVGQCPAFKEGCPFSGKNPEEIELLVKEIPKDHKLCPAFAPGENEKELSCMDGFSIIEFVKSIRNELFIEPLESGTQTLSNKMLEDTLDVHAEAERCIFIKHLIKGKISSDTYAKFLMCLYFIYSTMEEETIKFRTHPIVGLVHFPRQVNRIPSLLEDLEFFLGPNWKENAQPTKATKVYMDHIRDCAKNAPHQLISHAFTRYLGDMFGGQVISRKLKRNFSLKDERGTAFYRFENITDLADFREFYLGRLNAIRVDDQMKAEIIEASRMVFKLNIGIFDEFGEGLEDNEDTSKRKKNVTSSSKLAMKYTGSSGTSNVNEKSKQTTVVETKDVNTTSANYNNVIVALLWFGLLVYYLYSKGYLRF